MSATPDLAEQLRAGREALRAGAWVEARAAFEAATAAGDDPEAWESLSRSTWWLGDAEATFAARERAYRGYRRAGDARGAARMAAWLGCDHVDFRGDDAVAAAWLRRARDELADHPPCAEHGLIGLLEADIALLHHADPARALELAGEALELGRALGDRDLEVIGSAIVGSALVAGGRVEDGVRALDGAAALAVGEEFADALAPGWALCHTVSSCADVGEFARAAQWSRTMHGFCRRWSARHFFGVCRTAYGTVLTAHGDWPTAEQELTSAMDDLRAARPALAAPTAVRLGQLRARQGRTDEARALFESVLPFAAAIVAVGELELAVGDSEGAVEAAERVLRRLAPASPLERLPALELLARGRARAGEHDAAAAALDELEAVAERLSTPYLRARAALVHAEVRSEAGDHDGARRAAEDAADGFAACAAPYEAALARIGLARALAGLGRADRAEAEARAAREALAVLGRRRDHATPGEELTARELDVLRLVAQGLSDGEIAAQLFLSPHTVHRHVANVRRKLDLPSRAAAVAHAAQAGLL